MLIDFQLYLWSFGDSEKTHVWPLGNRLGKSEILHRNAARQTRENIMRIPQNGFIEMFQKIKILILDALFKMNLTSEEMLIKARPTQNQIERIVRFEF